MNFKTIDIEEIKQFLNGHYNAWENNIESRGDEDAFEAGYAQGSAHAFDRVIRFFEYGY